MEVEGYEPKTMRNLWVIVRLIWDAALAQGYVDRILPKPKLPRAFKKTPRYFRLTDVAKIIAAALRIDMANGAFYWLVAETGLRAGELAGLRLSNVYLDHITVSQGVWNGKASIQKLRAPLGRLRCQEYSPSCSTRRKCSRRKKDTTICSRLQLAARGT